MLEHIALTPARVHPNFPDPALSNWRWVCHGHNSPRLHGIKRRYEPAGALRFHQSL